MKNILSIAFILVAFAAKGQIQEYVIEASDSLITRGVLQIDADKFKATTQVSSDDTTLVSLDYLTNLLDAAEYADSLAFHSSTGYLVYYRAGVALDSTSMDNRYVPYTGANAAVNLGSQNLTTTGTVTGGNLNVANWNTAYGWGNHSGLYLPLTGGTMSNTNLVTNMNADLFDSKNSELYIYGNTTSGYQTNLSNDANQYYRAAFNTIYNVTNAPFAGDGGLLNIPAWNGQTSTSRYNIQIAGALNSSSNLWYRATDINGAGTWYRMYHSGNFIAGTNYQAPLTNPVTGTGSTNYLTKWTGLTTQGNSQITDNGTNVSIGSITATAKLNVFGNNATMPATSGTTQTGSALRLKNNGSLAVLDAGVYFGYGAWFQATNETNLGMYYPIMLNPRGGNVSIGATDTPTQKLDVNGNARFRSIGTTTTSTLLGVTSDGTLTTNVSITGGATWKGGWNASTNTPTLSDATGTNGWWYKVTAAGTQNLGSGSITFAVGDDVIHNGTVWQKFSAMITEADPVFVASDVYDWTTTDSTNWSTAYSWGDHSLVGYLTSEVDGSVTNELQNLSLGSATTTTQPINISNGTGVTLPAATTSAAGLMSAADKTALNGISTTYLPLTGGTMANTNLVTNMNADLLDGQQGNFYDQRQYSRTDNYLGGGYISGGLEKPNWAGFGGGKLKLQMLRNTNVVGAPYHWNDVLWISSYTGSDIKGSNALVFDKGKTGRVGFVQQDYDALDWGTYREFYHTGNFTDNSTNWNTAYGWGNHASAGYLTAEVDGSISNEGSLTVGAGTATTSVINSNTSGSTPVTLSVDGTNLGISEVGNTISLTNLKPDQTVTLTQGGATTITGTYPNFTISSTNTTYTAGTGISASGTTFNLGLEELTTGAPSLNTHWIPWVNSANNLHYRVGLLDLQEISGWDAGKLQNVPISSTTPTTNYVLKYNGSQWAPAVDATGSSYWTQASGALYPATIGDEVRIGSVTDLGAQKLQVDASSVFRLRNVSTSQPIDFITTGTGTQPYFRFEHDGSGGFRIASFDGSSSWNESFKITASSRTPQFPAGLILGTSFSTSTAGSVRWNGTNFQGYNGSTWVNLDTQGGGLADPMTTRGDIIYRNSSNVTARLGRGTAGQLLYSNGTDLSWRTPVKADIGLANVENTALSTWTGSTNLSTVGSITQGNWNADPISVTKGGTGKTSYTAYALLAGGTTSTGTLQQVSGVGTAGQVLTSNGAGALPSWQANSAGGWVDNGTDVVLSNTSDNVAIGASSAGTGNKLLVNGNIHTSSIFISSYITFNQLSGYLGSSSNPWLYTMDSDGGLIYQKGLSFDNYRYHLTSKIQPVTSSTATISYSTGDLAQDTLTTNTTYNITYIPDGAEGEIFVRQDGTGGRTLTLNLYPLSTSSTALTKVTAGATTGIKTTANKHTLIRYRRWGTKVTLEYLQEP